MLIEVSEEGLVGYVVCQCTLALASYGLGAYTAGLRVREQAVVNGEDVRPGFSVSEVEAPAVTRALRAHRNATENNSVFAILSALYLVAMDSPPLLPLYLFTAARITHSLAYLYALQPLRSIAYTLALICALYIIAVLLLVVAVGASEEHVVASTIWLLVPAPLMFYFYYID